jgi:hypothetical protein
MDGREGDPVTSALPVPVSRWWVRRLDWIVAAFGFGLAAIIVAFARWGPDWPAQEFRAWTAQHNGLTAWTNQWYSGEALPGYSVLYPAVSSWLGAALTGLVAVAAAYAAARRLAPIGSRVRELGYHAAVILVLAADLLIGQLPYLLGVAFGGWAYWAVRARRPFLASAMAAAASLSSPLAGAFALLLIPALVTAFGWRRAVPFGAGAVGVAVSVAYGGAGGPFPYLGRVLTWTLIFVVLALVLTDDRDRPVRVLALTYGAAAVGCFFVPNPIGGNLARLGQLTALPLLCHVFPRLRWRARATAGWLAFFAALWPVWPCATAIGRGAADPSQNKTFYTGLLAFLATQNSAAGRLEVVFTREHWESLWVAQAFPIARGWERQTDLGSNDVLYHPLTAASYRQWLDANAVALVALPRAPIDLGGRHEAQLLRHPPAYLKPVWSDPNWRVWRVRHARPLVTGPATMRALGPASFVLDFNRPGTAVVRIRASTMWVPTSGHACVGSKSARWLTVSAAGAGDVRIQARFDLDSVGAGARCA